MMVFCNSGEHVGSRSHRHVLPIQAGLVGCTTHVSLAGAWEWTRRTFVSMKPRRRAQISTFAIDKSPAQYCLVCTVNVKREFIFFCRLKINHKTDVYECVFIPGMLAQIRTPKASHDLYHWMLCRIRSSCRFSGAVWAAKYDPPLKGMSNEFEPASKVVCLH